MATTERPDAGLDRPLRVLLTADPELPVPPPLYGGIERIVDLLTRTLRRKGHVVGLVAHADSTVETDGFFAWPGRRSQVPRDTVRNLAALGVAVRAFEPDLLHSFSRLFYMGPLLPRPLPKVMAYQRAPGRRPVRWAARLSRGTLAFTGVSDHLCRQGAAAGGSWHRVHNAVDVDRYVFRPEVAPDAPLVFLSRVEPLKGAHLAIEIARRSGRRLVIAGNHQERGEEGDYWRERVAPWIGRDGIEYVGPVDDAAKNELLGAAAALLVPVQWDEPFGIVFAEALACGSPVISCPRGALPEIVDEGRHGFLVSSIDEGVRAVGRLGDIRRADCRSRAEHAFSADVMADRTLGLYRELLARGRGGEGRR